MNVGPEFSPIIVEGEELRTWRPNPDSVSDFGFTYGNLRGEHWRDAQHTVFHPNENPLIVDDSSYANGYVGEVVSHEEELIDDGPIELVKEATRLLLGKYYGSWVIKEFNREQAERAA